ncbi:TPA: hypothetical protein ACH3X3_010723 [Trebouxia sp. C0006]
MLSPSYQAGGLGTNKDMGGLLQQGGRDMLVYHAGVEGGVDSIAMQGSQKLGTPVRVIRRALGDNAHQASRRNAQSAKQRQYVYVYCGRYEVVDGWKASDPRWVPSGVRWYFKLLRLPGQAPLIPQQMTFRQGNSLEGHSFKMTWKAYEQTLQRDCCFPEVGLETVACHTCIPLEQLQWIMADEEGRHWRCKRCRKKNVLPLVGTVFESAGTVPPAGFAPSFVAAAALPAPQAAAPILQAALPNAHAALPFAQAALPFAQAAALPIAQAALPVAQAASSIAQAALPFAQAALPFAQAALPFAQAALPIAQAASPLAQAASSIAQAAEHQQRAAAPVGGAAAAHVITLTDSDSDGDICYQPGARAARKAARPSLRCRSARVSKPPVPFVAAPHRQPRRKKQSNRTACQAAPSAPLAQPPAPPVPPTTAPSAVNLPVTAGPTVPAVAMAQLAPLQAPKLIQPIVLQAPEPAQPALPAAREAAAKLPVSMTWQAWSTVN